MPFDLYCDGGVIGPNPSSLGGTWAFCQVANNGRVLTSSGIITPKQVGLPQVTNNVSELWAAVMALSTVPNGWAGTLHTDSLCTLYRLRRNCKKFAGVPDSLRERVKAELRRLGQYQLRLVGGHPTPQELAQGYLQKNRLPTSLHNVWCDQECNRQKELFVPDSPSQVNVFPPIGGNV